MDAEGVVRGQAGRHVERRDNSISGSVNSLWELALQSLFF